jgi:uncharacterized protein DUF1592/uncharacterized protein DUF1588/uncharacterized protein DUF1587/uncharacterized protein DUF1585/uncharacterized protein DUF1595
MLRWVSLAAFALAAAQAASAGEPSLALLGSEYEREVRSLTRQYCFECHSADLAEADVNLEAMPVFADVRKHVKIWQKVGEVLDGGQMPPRDARQPSEAEQTQLQSWVRRYLTLEAQARAGDPGPVVLRRLSNAEYTFTVRDLTGVPTLAPAREFPIDGAAGEGFTNTGNALVMSPTLATKYLDAAKEIADHAVLLPDGVRFSPSTTRRDWTNEILAQIRQFYREFTDPGGADQVNLQGAVFNTNQGGRLPLEKYLAATIVDRAEIAAGTKTIATVARERGLSAKYLGLLWSGLVGTEPSLLMDDLRSRWKLARPEDVAALTSEISRWQKGLWKFSPVGHIGKVGGPKAWLEPASPLVARQELRFKIPSSPDGSDVVLSLVASDAGDGHDHDVVVWQQPRLVARGQPDLLLRDVREVVDDSVAHRERLFAQTAVYLAAAAEAAAADGPVDVAALARKHSVDVAALQAWLDYLGIGSGNVVALSGHFTQQITNSAGYPFIQGWGTSQTPLLVSNSSDQLVHIPGNMRPHSVAVHPSPTVRVGVGWRSPITGTIHISGGVLDAHRGCGNGVTWALELRRGTVRRRLASGATRTSNMPNSDPPEKLTVHAGDLVSLLVSSREGNHSCDLTDVSLKFVSDDGRRWDLVEDVSGDVLAGNPHADRLGNAGVWHFYTETDSGDADIRPAVPAGSVLARWQAASTAQEKQSLAEAVQALLTSPRPAGDKSPDHALHQQLVSLGGPLLSVSSYLARRGEHQPSGNVESRGAPTSSIGLDPALFGKRPDGGSVDAASLCVQAPVVLEFRLPAELAEGCELVATGMLDRELGAEGSVQLAIVAGRPSHNTALVPSEAQVKNIGGQWTDPDRQTSYAAPIIVQKASAARQRMEKAFVDFRRLFPAALCYTQIVPTDEVVTLTLFYREDDHLVRLMLDESQGRRLDGLWDELHYVSRDALTLVDALAQLLEYASQDGNPKLFEPLRKPFQDRADAFRQRLIDTEPRHLDALVAFAARAYRRPLSEAENRSLRALYADLRKEEIPHDEALRLTLARVLVSPAFLYRIEQPREGSEQGPVDNFELASRLSYFLWSSPPDDELRRVASQGHLVDPDVLTVQTRRMLGDEKTRRLATEFACQWLQIHSFDELDEKSERHFPTFNALRAAMYEESIQFFTHLMQDNGSVLDILDGDYTYLNEELARHYGIAGVQGSEWRRLDGIKKSGRGGILAQATTLAKNSGASRTSPILRGNWICEVLLGDKLPRPPKNVPQLPDDEASLSGLTVRQITEKHSSDPKCASCHRRIDPLGYSLEGFDAIGRRREKDLGDRPIDTRVTTLEGVEFTGLGGLRDYLLNYRREAFVRQFCRKLLGFALGRAVQLSDEPLLAKMHDELQAHDYRFLVAVEAIVGSKQFREIRGREAALDD